MTPQTRSRDLEALTGLLEEQRVALREGRLKDLAAMVPRMERAIGAVTACKDQTAREDLQRLASENATLLKAAQAGVAQAKALRTAAAEVRLSTYDATGRKSEQELDQGRTLARR